MIRLNTISVLTLCIASVHILESSDRTKPTIQPTQQQIIAYLFRILPKVSVITQNQLTQEEDQQLQDLEYCFMYAHNMSNIKKWYELLEWSQPTPSGNTPSELHSYNTRKQKFLACQKTLDTKIKAHEQNNENYFQQFLTNYPERALKVQEYVQQHHTEKTSVTLKEFIELIAQEEDDSFL